MRIEREQAYMPPRLGLWLLQGLILLLFIILCSRFWYLQILRGSDYASLAEANRTRTEEIFATRGMIFDRNGEKLAIDDITYDITIIREDCPNPEATIARLATILGTERSELQETYYESRAQRTIYEPTLVLEDIDFEEVAAIESNIMFLPGVYIETNARRNYPQGAAFAHILGYVAEANQEDMATIPELSLGDTVGRQGIELIFENILRGTKGEYLNERNVFGKVLSRELQEPPYSGENLVLSLDAHIQNEIIEIMEGQAGTVVVMDPHSGQLIAMVTLPSYDNNLFVQGFSHQEWNEISTNIYSPLQNRAIQSMYPPGSVWKVMMAGLFLSAGVDPEEEVYCSGSHTYGNNTFECWRAGGHGNMNLSEALEQSCDVYFYVKGEEMGINNISDYAFQSGFGNLTQIDLPNEKAGLVPTREWKLERYNEPWQGGETLNVSIGQGQTLVTPLQVAVFISSLLNGGDILKPQILLDAPREVLSQTPITEEQSQLIQDIMISTATHGTARVLTQPNPEIIVGGKTGTAQVVSLQMDGSRRLSNEELEYLRRDHAWIASFVKYQEQEYVIVTMIEHGGGGSTVAGPITRDVIDCLIDDNFEENPIDIN